MISAVFYPKTQRERERERERLWHLLPSSKCLRLGSISAHRLCRNRSERSANSRIKTRLHWGLPKIMLFGLVSVVQVGRRWAPPTPRPVTGRAWSQRTVMMKSRHTEDRSVAAHESTPTSLPALTTRTRSSWRWEQNTKMLLELHMAASSPLRLIALHSRFCLQIV